MNSADDDAVPKVHPASREMLPDDPLEPARLRSPRRPGVDAAAARRGIRPHGLGRWTRSCELARDPNYHGVSRPVAARTARRNSAAASSGILARCGVIRVKADGNRAAVRSDLVQIDLAGRNGRRESIDHAHGLQLANRPRDELSARGAASRSGSSPSCSIRIAASAARPARWPARAPGPSPRARS